MVGMRGIMLILLAYIVLQTVTCDVRMLIKHKSSGMFWQPNGGSQDPSDDTRVVVNSGRGDQSIFVFEHYEKQWGFIRHETSGKYVHPFWGIATDITDLVLYSGKHAECLFALDANRDVIEHKGGKYVHPYGGKFHPYENTVLRFFYSVHDGMKWLFVDPNDPNKEIPPYGKAKLTGSWKIVNSVLNPRATHEYTVQIKVGKSKTESSTFSFKYTWEVNAGGSIDMFNFGGSATSELMYSKTTSQTWSEESIVTRKITVKPGESVVTWQYDFAIDQNEHSVLYRSNILADTDSADTVPDSNHILTV